TKQTARKSTGGKHPRKRLSSNRSKTLIITDHTGNNVTIPGGSSRVGLGFFPFQVYILASAASLCSDSEFPQKLRSYIISNDACIRFNENCHWRLEIFSLPQASVLDCINHHEQEKRYRKSVGKGPIMLNRKELLVVDDVEWGTKGLLSVEYTAQFLGRDGSEREFENHVNDHPSWQDDEEELALPKLRKDLTVLRYPNVNQLAERFLQFVWDDEGHEWAYSSLMERNVALAPSLPRDIEGYMSLMTAYVEVDEDIDSIGRECVICNHVRRPIDKTHFSFNLYVIGQRPESPQLLFNLLNERLLEYIPMKLHVYIVPDLSTAFSHHDDEMATRPSSGRLPTSYAGLPEQPQSHIFLYIDEYMVQHKGPKVVTRDPAMEGPMLEVMHAGSWGSAADMLLTYFTLCTETPRPRTLSCT
ncbi:unnamed protein product, partial [Aureobasidium uvarum]